MKTLSILSVLIVLLTPIMVCSDEPDKTLHQKCLYPTVLINNLDNSSTGTGVIVRSDKVGKKYHNVVLTCGHLARWMGRYEATVAKYIDWSTIQNVDKFRCAVQTISVKNDLSVMMFVSEEQMPAADFDFDSTLYFGSDVFRIGCGWGDPMRIDYGKITGLKFNPNVLIRDVYRMSIYTVPGDSGSAVFHNYKIVGITQAVRHIGGISCYEISYSIPISRLKTWDKEINNTVEFVYNKDAKLPVIWDKFLEFDTWEERFKIPITGVK